MPCLDMPRTSLENYMGTNPRPADFDDYWDNAIGEMKATDPSVSMSLSHFQAPNVTCYDMYFTGVNGARIYVKFACPKDLREKVPAVIKFHGYGYYNHSWAETLSYAGTGIAVFAMDARGQGGYSEDVCHVKGTTIHGQIIRGLDEEDPNKLLFRDIFLDAAELAGIAMDMDCIDETRVYATGGSQGGGLTIACAALEPRIRKAAAFYPFLCDYKRVWDVDLASAGYKELRDYFRNYDPLHERENEIFTKLGYIDVQHLAGRVCADTMVFTGLMDNVAPPSAQYAVYNKLKCRKKHVIYPDYGHEYMRDVDDLIYNFLVNDIW